MNELKTEKKKKVKRNQIQFKKKNTKNNKAISLYISKIISNNYSNKARKNRIKQEKIYSQKQLAKKKKEKQKEKKKKSIEQKKKE